jgi:hypothetical protein
MRVSLAAFLFPESCPPVGARKLNLKSAPDRMMQKIFLVVNRLQL